MTIVANLPAKRVSTHILSTFGYCTFILLTYSVPVPNLNNLLDILVFRYPHGLKKVENDDKK